MATPLSGIAVVAATGLEARAVRRRAPDARVVESGIALRRLLPEERFEVAISCGLAGGLDAELASGTVVIPDYACSAEGAWVACDAELTARLRDAARGLDLRCVTAPLLTSSTLVIGDRRTYWAHRGFCAVDMETASIPATRLAAVRVILDTPRRELSVDWLNPARAMMRPSNWRQAIWLARAGPQCADIAARIIANALSKS